MEKLNRIESLLSMLQSEPKDIFLNYSLGLEYVALNNLDLAEDQFKKTLVIQSDYIPAFYQLGKLLESKGNNEEALKFYNLGLEQAKLQGNNKAFNEFSEAVFMLE